MKKELLEKLADAKKGLGYCEKALQTNLEAWERKEFEAVKNDYIGEIESLEYRLANYF